MPAKAIIDAKQVIMSKKLSCKTCKITFHCKEELEQHLSSHEDLLSYYECFHCLKRFGNITDRDKHLVTHTGGSPESFHSCNQCKQIFQFNDDLQTHVQEKHLSQKNKKKKSKPVTSTPGIESYEETENETLESNTPAEGTEQYWCTDCNIHFTGYTGLYKHRRTYHKYLYTCNTCGQGFSTKFKVKHHSLKHLSKIPARYSSCKVCGKMILTKNMDLHRFIVHSKNNRRFNCDICGYKFKRQFHLFRHMNAHKRKVSKYCRICHRRFVRITSLEEHIKTCKSSEGELNRQDTTSSPKTHSAVPELNHSIKVVTKWKSKSSRNIPKSDRSLVGKTVLQGNVIVKESERKQKYGFRCDLCGKVFKLKSNFEIHKKIHRDFLSFQCSHCDNKFKTKTALNSHSCNGNEVSKEKKTSGIKSSGAVYVCNICNKSFKLQTSLFSHSKSHRDFLSFKCSHCDQKFKTKTARKSHSCTDNSNEVSKGKKRDEVKSSGVGYMCNICNKSFKLQTSLSSHSKSHREHLFYKCNVCCHGFSTQTKLKAHLCKGQKNSATSEDDMEVGELTGQDNRDRYNVSLSYKCLICMKSMHEINNGDNVDHTHVMVLVT